MEKNILFDTSIGTQNLGDYIISESVEQEMKDIFKKGYLLKLPTHTPISHFYQNLKKNPIFKYCYEANYKFISGTNIIQYRMIRPWSNWNMNIFNYKPYKDAILIGVGLNPNRKNMDFYTKILYTKVLNKNYIHSVRDEKTKKVLESLGFKAINTGCATLWMLNKTFCASIPKQKAKKVIFTLTDYCQDKEKDQHLIDILNNEYKEVFFWIQGSEDYNYFKTFKNIQNITVINPNLKEYYNFLKNNDADYVGTRLHAGIYALQHKRRTIIISIDNRTRDMKESYNIPCIERTNIDKLSNMINSKIKTEININEKAIKEWKSQFK